MFFCISNILFYFKYTVYSFLREPYFYPLLFRHFDYIAVSAISMLDEAKHLLLHLSVICHRPTQLQSRAVFILAFWYLILMGQHFSSLLVPALDREVTE